MPGLCQGPVACQLVLHTPQYLATTAKLRWRQKGMLLLMAGLTLSTGAAKQALLRFLSQQHRMSPAGQQITAVRIEATKARVGPTTLKWQGFCRTQAFSAPPQMVTLW